MNFSMLWVSITNTHAYVLWSEQMKRLMSSFSMEEGKPATFAIFTHGSIVPCFTVAKICKNLLEYMEDSFEGFN